eukprot:gene17053-23348_t
MSSSMCAASVPVFELQSKKALVGGGIGDCKRVPGPNAQSVDTPCWEAAETASSLMASGQLPPFVIVGVDHTWLTRAYDYNPYVPGTGPGSFRKDAAKWPGGGVDQYLDRVVNEVMPFIRERYGVSGKAPLVAMGGASFGGIATLCMYPHLLDCALVESPSLWIKEASFFKDDIANYKGPLPERIFVAMGDLEYTGIRPASAANPKADAWLADSCERLGDMLEEKGLKRGQRLHCEVEKGATHNEKSWAARLPRALLFLCSQWKGLQSL